MGSVRRNRAATSHRARHGTVSPSESAPLGPSRLKQSAPPYPVRRRHYPSQVGCHSTRARVPRLVLSRWQVTIFGKSHCRFRSSCEHRERAELIGQHFVSLALDSPQLAATANHEFVPVQTLPVNVEVLRFLPISTVLPDLPEQVLARDHHSRCPRRKVVRQVQIRVPALDHFCDS